MIGLNSPSSKSCWFSLKRQLTIIAGYRPLPPLDFHRHYVFIDAMNIFDLTINQLKRAAAIKEQIEALNNELRNILGASAKSGAAPKKKRATRAPGKTSTAAKPATVPVKSAAKAKKKTFSPATRAKLSAKLKAYWAAKKAGKK